MNRKKKIQGLFKKRLKRARAKLNTQPNRNQYVSKADRAKAETEALLAAENTSNEDDSEQAKTVEVDSNTTE